MKNLICGILLAFIAVSTNAQSVEQDEKAASKLQSVKQLLRDGKTEDAEKKLIGILKKYPHSGDAWDLKSIVDYRQMLKARNQKITATVKVSGNDPKADSMARALEKLLAGFSMEAIMKESLHKTMRYATAFSTTSESSSIYMRTLFGPNADTVFTSKNEKAVEFYETAEKLFAKEDFAGAAENYEEALALDSGYYKAMLYLGDAYFRAGEHKEALQRYRMAMKMMPNDLEPVKYITDAFIGLSEWDSALLYCGRALMTYADIGMVYKWRYIHFKAGNKVSEPRLIRYCEVAGPDEEYEIDAKDDYAPIIKKLRSDKAWTTYRETALNYKSKSSNAGILENDPARYLEVKCWEKMLKTHATDPRFSLAQKAYKKGYLDCYVFLFNFHNDLYPQYQDFVSRNEKKCLEFLDWANQGFQ